MRTERRPDVHLMRAVVQDRYGSTEVLTTRTIDVPTPGDTEVLVRIHAAGVDRGVWHLMTGRPYLLRLAFGLRAPQNPVLGGDLAGTVVAVGTAVRKFAVGDEVYGFGAGTFAEFAIAREDKLAVKPAELTFAQAAALPVSGATALQALELGRVRRGHRVLVIGASGGVGSFAVQMAKALGADVTGVASTAKLESVRALGADRVLDYTRADFADGSDAYDVILDIGGNPTLRRLRRALTRDGTAVIVGGERGGSWTGGMHRTVGARIQSLFLRQRLTNFIAKQRSSDLDRISELVREGSVAPLIHSIRPLDCAADAIAMLEGGHVLGKCVLTP